MFRLCIDVEDRDDDGDLDAAITVEVFGLDVVDEEFELSYEAFKDLRDTAMAAVSNLFDLAASDEDEDDEDDEEEEE